VSCDAPHNVTYDAAYFAKSAPGTLFLQQERILKLNGGIAIKSPNEEIFRRPAVSGCPQDVR
jgi:hypothetical protein